MRRLLEYINEETDNVNLFESTIIGIKLDANTSNMELTIDWTESDNISFIFENCRDLKIDLKHHSDFLENETGILEITGFSYKRVNEEFIIQFDFDFNLVGQIQFKCMRFVLYTPSLPMQSGGNDNLIL